MILEAGFGRCMEKWGLKLHEILVGLLKTSRGAPFPFLVFDSTCGLRGCQEKKIWIEAEFEPGEMDFSHFCGARNQVKLLPRLLPS